MAITDAEKQEIIDGLLAEIRANGLDYSGQTITFPDAFNVTQTERQNVKIPAIDERKSTVVHGNVDLESLLQAYGLTEVQQIASEVSTNYMPRTEVQTALNGKAPAGYGLGETTGKTISSLDEVTEYGFYRMPTGLGITPDDLTNWGGVFVGANINYGALVVANSLNDIGLLSKTGTWKTQWQRISTFPFGDTTRDNRINAMGAGYIRWENGFQICWGNFTVAMPASYAIGNVYRATYTGAVGFSQPFSESYPYVCTVFNRTDVPTNVVQTQRNGNSITSITVERPQPWDASTVYLSYSAIGRWK